MRTVPLTRPSRHAAGSALTLLAVLSLLSACTAANRGNTETARIDRAIDGAARFLVSRQSADGSWRSEVYGGFRDGTTLTPPILKFLFFASGTTGDARPSYRRGVDFLVALVDDDAIAPDRARALLFPVYTAAAASIVIDLESRDARHSRASAAWLKLLREHHMGGDNGWASGDSVFGGWGYATRIPRKPARGEIPYEANLSATIFGLGALRHAGIPRNDPVYSEILSFVQRCQNFSADPGPADRRYDDGGFFFTPADPPRNKAGSAGTDSTGRERFNSYGSATADGLRALLRCGLPPGHPRVVAARKWLELNFSASRNPGRFPEDREVLRDAIYYYYCWSVAHSFMVLQETDASFSDNGMAGRARELARELVRRQAPDGSWVNGFRDGKEDDPLVATPLAAASLVICREILQKTVLALR